MCKKREGQLCGGEPAGACWLIGVSGCASGMCCVKKGTGTVPIVGWCMTWVQVEITWVQVEIKVWVQVDIRVCAGREKVERR